MPELKTKQDRTDVVLLGEGTLGRAVLGDTVPRVVLLLAFVLDPAVPVERIGTLGLEGTAVAGVGFVLLLDVVGPLLPLILLLLWSLLKKPESGRVGRFGLPGGALFSI